jgi:hypothetical protein
MITNDSGPAHFASLTEMPTFVLYCLETPRLYGALGRATPSMVAWRVLLALPLRTTARHRIMIMSVSRSLPLSRCITSCNLSCMQETRMSETVPAAAGAAGTVVCQMATWQGCRVVGSASAPHNVAWFQEDTGTDATVN